MPREKGFYARINTNSLATEGMGEENTRKGHVGIRLSLSGHAIRRYQERIRPDLSIQECQIDILRQDPVTFRQNNKDRAWLLRFAGPPAFTLLAFHHVYAVARTRHVTQQFRVITTLAGHDHF